MNNDPEFDDIINTETWGPYGTPVQPVRPGLTKRGKAALTIGAAVIAGGGILTWQNYQAESQASELKAQEIQYKRDLLALEMQREINKADAANQKAQQSDDAEKKKMIQACVNADKGLIGKQMGVTYSSVVKDCTSQYKPSAGSVSMQTAASESAAGTTGGLSPTGMLAIGSAAALAVGVAAIRGKKTANAA